MSEKMYRICLRVPLGVRDGTLYLCEADGKAEGWLEVMNHRNELAGTIFEDGTMKLYGNIETVVETLSYTAVGVSSKGKISLTLITKSGEYPVTGEEVSEF